MNRRNFLTRSGLALGALIVGDEVLETLDRLTHRRVWAGHTFAPRFQDARYLRTWAEVRSSSDALVKLQYSADGSTWYTQEELVTRADGNVLFGSEIPGGYQIHASAALRYPVTMDINSWLTKMGRA